ncbi:MAG: 3'-5' exoribonuclease [Myxococcota bacterium]
MTLRTPFQAPTVPRISEKPGNSNTVDEIYLSVDIETDGPIPGEYSMLSFALVYAGRRAGANFERPCSYDVSFYSELQPISTRYEEEALKINGLDREKLARQGASPQDAMEAAAVWIRETAAGAQPILVAYPLSFDWSFLHWYFVNFTTGGSPFRHSGCFDLKTAVAVKAGRTITEASRSKLPERLRTARHHSHHALDDAIEQAEIFANLIEWEPSRSEEAP